MEDTIVAYINKAQTTLDMCVYDNRSDAIIDAVNQAYSRGVVVRFISETTALNSSLSDLNISVPLLKRDDGTNVMHNKFVIIDRDSDNGSWLITGSANHTPDNLTVDPNNVVFIQDKMLALAYTAEFEEMWGSAGTTPNISNSKFGAAKTDNTPHTFTIGGKTVELYFSPSDGTSSHIETAVHSAVTDFCFAMFTFIHNGIGDAVVDVHNAGAAVRGIIENIYYIGSEYSSLVAAGIPVLSHQTIPNSFHHKYGVADATDQNSDPLVITGSHNWTNSAEDDYDENTLIIHDGQVAAMYFEEFMTRYNELSAGISTGKQMQNSIYYDPGNNSLVFYNSGSSHNFNLDVYNLLGAKIAGKSLSCMTGSQSSFVLPTATPSIFLVVIADGSQNQTLKFVVKK
ncbi:MAG TPA: phospholipase D-like domain-containing protein [Bacteroidales bacterium]|nr:phospholipase D-like domain-containing protein [Bacteroidales bacterium]